MSSFLEQADAPRLLQEALDLAEQQQDVEELERIHTALGGYYQTQGEPERAFEHFRRTRECEPYTGNRMRGDMNIALLYWGTGDLEEARRLFSAALSTAVRAGDPGSEIIASLNLGYTLMLLGKLEQAEPRMLQTRNLLSLSTTHDPRAAAWTHHSFGRLRLAQGRLDEARLELEQAEQVPDELLQKHNRVRWTLARAELETLSGRLSAARIALDGAARVVRDAPVRERSVVAELERVREMLEARSHR
jgi:tetratricopeptide (TPR) repeat protein